jgi:hypothetical protein
MLVWKSRIVNNKLNRRAEVAPVLELYVFG